METLTNSQLVEQLSIVCETDNLDGLKEIINVMHMRYEEFEATGGRMDDDFAPSEDGYLGLLSLFNFEGMDLSFLSAFAKQDQAEKGAVKPPPPLIIEPKIKKNASALAKMLLFRIETSNILDFWFQRAVAESSSFDTEGNVSFEFEHEEQVVEIAITNNASDKTVMELLFNENLSSKTKERRLGYMFDSLYEPFVESYTRGVYRSMFLYTGGAYHRAFHQRKIHEDMHQKLDRIKDFDIEKLHILRRIFPALADDLWSLECDNIVDLIAMHQKIGQSKSLVLMEWMFDEWNDYFVHKLHLEQVIPLVISLLETFGRNADDVMAQQAGASASPLNINKMGVAGFLTPSSRLFTSLKMILYIVLTKSITNSFSKDSYNPTMPTLALEIIILYMFQIGIVPSEDEMRSWLKPDYRISNKSVVEMIVWFCPGLWKDLVHPYRHRYENDSQHNEADLQRWAEFVQYFQTAPIELLSTTSEFVYRNAANITTLPWFWKNGIEGTLGTTNDDKANTIKMATTMMPNGEEYQYTI